MTRTIILVAATLAASLAAAQAEQCRVSDPTGTPLNVREVPGGRIIGTLRNGNVVFMNDTVDDRRDVRWAEIRLPASGAKAYVVREYITCKP